MNECNCIDCHLFLIVPKFFSFAWSLIHTRIHSECRTFQLKDDESRCKHSDLIAPKVEMMYADQICDSLRPQPLQTASHSDMWFPSQMNSTTQKKSLQFIFLGADTKLVHKFISNCTCLHFICTKIQSLRPALHVLLGISLRTFPKTCTVIVSRERFLELVETLLANWQ